MEILGLTKDYRTQTYVIYTKIPIIEYLNIVGDEFDEFAIQRKREKHKVYKRMKQDIQRGALLPGITLSVKPNHVDEIVRCIENDTDYKSLLVKDGHVDILDGLQRTYILRELKDEGFTFIEEQSLLVEFWLEKDEKHLIYRLLVLNAGQKPMSTRHQVEILFSLLKENIESRVDGLELYSERDGKRRNGPGKFQFDKITDGYQCFLSRSTEIVRENLIAEKIQEDAVLLSDETHINDNYDLFIKYLSYYCQLDKLVFKHYSTFGNDDTYENWCNDSTVIQSYFAAVGKSTITRERETRADKSIMKLIEDLKNPQSECDPLGLLILEKVKNGINPRKKNVGSETRKIISKSFGEYFREDGEVALHHFWSMEAE